MVSNTIESSGAPQQQTHPHHQPVAARRLFKAVAEARDQTAAGLTAINDEIKVSDLPDPTNDQDLLNLTTTNTEASGTLSRPSRSRTRPQSAPVNPMLELEKYLTRRRRFMESTPPAPSSLSKVRAHPGYMQLLLFQKTVDHVTTSRKTAEKAEALEREKESQRFPFGQTGSTMSVREATKQAHKADREWVYSSFVGGPSPVKYMPPSCSPSNPQGSRSPSPSDKSKARRTRKTRGPASEMAQSLLTTDSYGQPLEATPTLEVTPADGSEPVFKLVPQTSEAKSRPRHRYVHVPGDGSLQRRAPSPSTTISPIASQSIEGPSGFLETSAIAEPSHQAQQASTSSSSPSKVTPAIAVPMLPKPSASSPSAVPHPAAYSYCPTTGRRIRTQRAPIAREDEAALAAAVRHDIDSFESRLLTLTMEEDMMKSMKKLPVHTFAKSSAREVEPKKLAAPEANAVTKDSGRDGAPPAAAASTDFDEHTEPRPTLLATIMDMILLQQSELLDMIRKVPRNTIRHTFLLKAPSGKLAGSQFIDFWETILKVKTDHEDVRRLYRMVAKGWDRRISFEDLMRAVAVLTGGTCDQNTFWHHVYNVITHHQTQVTRGELEAALFTFEGCLKEKETLAKTTAAAAASTLDTIPSLENTEPKTFSDVLAAPNAQQQPLPSAKSGRKASTSAAAARELLYAYPPEPVKPAKGEGPDDPLMPASVLKDHFRAAFDSLPWGRSCVVTVTDLQQCILQDPFLWQACVGLEKIMD